MFKYRPILEGRSGRKGKDMLIVLCNDLCNRRLGGTRSCSALPLTHYVTLLVFGVHAKEVYETRAQRCTEVSLSQRTPHTILLSGGVYCR